VSLISRLGLLEPQKASPSSAALVNKSKSPTGDSSNGEASGTSGAHGKLTPGGGPPPNLANLNYKDLFSLADQDKSGALTFEEFMDVLKYLNMPLSQNVALRIFSECEKDGVIGPDEFEKCMHLVESKVGDKVLTSMGLSTQTLVLAFLGLSFILLLLFAFIFLGIGAFTTGNTFEAVVNSFIAMSAGGAVGANRGKTKTERVYVLKDTLHKVMERLKRPL